MHTRSIFRLLSLVLVITIAIPAFAAESPTSIAVKTLRVPEGGIQPQVMMDHAGTLHLVFYHGNPRVGNLFYVKSTDNGGSFSKPIRVNSQPESAVAVGTVRGAQIAVSGSGRVHVIWNGAKKAEPRAPGDHEPLLYTRLNDEASGFDAQRNIIQQQIGLDGGSSVAADAKGNVYVVWHAPAGEKHDEANRAVWVARSRDDGTSFTIEQQANPKPRGACGCCGLKAFSDQSGKVYILYRSAWDMVNRNMYLLVSNDQGETFAERGVHEWEIGQCVMSSAAFGESSRGALAAWETKNQIYFAMIDSTTGALGTPIKVPGEGSNRKHPAVASNDQGQILVAWSEGTNFGKGGEVVWQLFDKEGKPIAEAQGRMSGLPAWSMVAAYTTNDGGFMVVY